MQIVDISQDNHFVVASWGQEWELTDYSPYVEDKKYLFIQPKNENDGGLVFFKVGDQVE